MRKLQICERISPDKYEVKSLYLYIINSFLLLLLLLFRTTFEK